MLGDSSTTQETEFVFRRLAEGLQIAGKEVNPYLWLAILVPVLILGIVYAGWMYARDSRSVGKAWAAFLATLRCAVYLILALVFLLPAWQTWDRAEHRSKVVLLIDVSGSMATKDDVPTESMPVEKLLSRQDKAIRFLSDSQIAFLKRLEAKNPVSAYRFGSVVDEEFQAFDAGREWTAQEWQHWLTPNPRQEIPADMAEEDKNKLRKKLDLEALLVSGTNLADSLLSVLNRESNSMLQGIVVISDGRSTQFSTQALEELRARTNRENAPVPVFTVAVGEERQPINIRITDLQAPDQARPDDKFPVRVEIDGEGLAGKDVDVSLDVTKPDGQKVTLKPNVKPGETPTFKPGEPPHAQVEFEIDKPQIEGEWKLVARVPKDRREVYLPKEHVTDAVSVNVVKKPLRVLLFAGAPTHDYQFVRNLFVRETDRHRAELSIYLQLARPEIVQDVPAERLLRHFPSALSADDPRETAEERYYNLAQYDLIIAFDPDWTQLSPQELGLLEKWVGSHAGGLILVAGQVNTYQLARGINYERAKPILDLFPVVLEDSRVQSLGIERSSSEPWRLNFPGASADMEFLKLDEDSKDPLAGWEEFFTGRHRDESSKEAAVRRGFFNYYPVKAIKPSATVVATFADPRARLSDGREQPYIVTMPYGNGRVVYLGAGEVWRLRQYREVFHERFWTKLARYAGSGNLTRLNHYGVLVMGKTFTANNFVRVEAQLFGRDLQPLPKTEKPKGQIKPPSGVTTPTTFEMQAKPGQGTDNTGWFQGRFLVTTAGTYELQLQVPGTPEVLSKKFVVKESNLELDNTMPDFAQLRQLASEASRIMARVSDEVKIRLKPELERMNKVSLKETAEDQEPARLFFDLKAAALIPDCMVTERKIQKSRGPVRDIWDSGMEVGNADPPSKLSTALLVIVGLLSTEWLIRKLLKLA
jgi:hypothetical protein